MRKTGDKPEIHGSKAGKAVLVTLILQQIEQEHFHLLRVPCSEISKIIQGLGQTHSVRSYTNAYGNLKGAMTKEDFSFIFTFDGYIIKLVSLEQCKTSFEQGKISDEDFALCTSIYDKYDANVRAMNNPLNK